MRRGALRIERASTRPGTACHCDECRRWSGHVWAAASIPSDALRVEGDVHWFESSDKARRGFCPICGSNLFWDPSGKGSVSVAAGSIDGPTGLKLKAHIFVPEKGDYYEIEDGVPQFARGTDDG